MSDRLGRELDLPDVASNVSVPLPTSGAISVFGRSNKLVSLNSAGIEVPLRRREHYIVTTSASGLATVTFATPFTTPHVTVSPKSLDANDARQVTAEIVSLSTTSVTVKTTREGAGIVVLGVLVLPPSAGISTQAYITVTELA